jgi:subtilisin family serine protease
MRRLIPLFFLGLGIVSSVHARYLDPTVTYANDRLIVRTWPESADLSPTVSGNRVILADPELTQLNERWGVVKVERLFPAASLPDRPDSRDLDTYWRFWLEPNTMSEEVLSDFAKAVAVEHVEPVGVHQVCFDPNDPAYIYQWYLRQTTADHDIDAPEAWDLQRGNADAIIGLMDTGVQYEHPDLAANIWINEAEQHGDPGFDEDNNGYTDDYHGWDFIVYEMVYPGEDGRFTDNEPTDFVGHGTHIAGTAAGVLNNATGISGIAGGGSGAEGARIMALRIGWMGADGNGYVAMDYAAQAIEYGRQKGVTVFSCAWTSSNSGGFGAAVTNAINDGIIFCVAAGNSNNDSPYYLNTRGDCIDVAAVDNNDKKTRISSYGEWVDICAPGHSIYSTYSNHYTNTYAHRGGTSMASAMLTGATALVQSQQPTWTREQVTAALLAGVDDISAENPNYDGLLGSGRTNLYLALLNTGSYTVTSPNGGERWVVEDTATITWETDFMQGGILVSLNRQFPDGEWEDIYSGTPASNAISVAVTGPQTTRARLRIMSQLAPAVYDVSDNDFTIRLHGSGLLPGYDSPVVVAYRHENDIVLYWTNTGAPTYAIYSSSDPTGSFAHLERLTTQTHYVDRGALLRNDLKFYQVRSSTVLR